MPPVPRACQASAAGSYQVRQPNNPAARPGRHPPCTGRSPRRAPPSRRHDGAGGHRAAQPADTSARDRPRPRRVRRPHARDRPADPGHDSPHVDRDPCAARSCPVESRRSPGAPSCRSRGCTAPMRDAASKADAAAERKPGSSSTSWLSNSTYWPRAAAMCRSCATAYPRLLSEAVRRVRASLAAQPRSRARLSSREALSPDEQLDSRPGPARSAMPGSRAARRAPLYVTSETVTRGLAGSRPVPRCGTVHARQRRRIGARAADRTRSRQAVEAPGPDVRRRRAGGRRRLALVPRLTGAGTSSSSRSGTCRSG